MVRYCGMFTIKCFAIITVLCAATICLAQQEDSMEAEEIAPQTQNVQSQFELVNDSHFKPEKRSVPLPVVLPGETSSAIIPIKGAITTTTFKAIRRKVTQIKSSGCKLVIIDMDTPGGQVSAAGQIVKLIRSDLKDIRTIAFVNSNDGGYGAISAGAWIAVSCDQIIMSPLTKIGDCAPILSSGTLAGHEREKIETYLRTEFRQAAEANGYSIELLESMVSMHKSVYHIENTKTGQHQLVDNAKYKLLIDSDDDEDKEKDWKLVEKIVGDNELLTMTTAEAKKIGICYATANSIDAILEHLGITEPALTFEDNWSEVLTSILTGPTITSILVLGMIFFGSIEMRTPGMGIFGGLAIACLAILIGSRFLTGLALWWEIGLMVVGIILLLLEFFVIPGFGIAGFSGFVCMLVAMMAMLIDNAPGELPLPTGQFSTEFFVNSLVAIMIGFLGALVLSVIVGKYLPKIPVANRLMLQSVPAANSDEPAIDDLSPLRKISVGAKGTLICDCRPSGKARFGETILDVTTDGEFLAKGEKIVAVEVKSGYVLIGTEEA